MSSATVSTHNPSMTLDSPQPTHKLSSTLSSTQNLVPALGSRRFRSDAASFSPSARSTYPYYTPYATQPSQPPQPHHPSQIQQQNQAQHIPPMDQYPIFWPPPQHPAAGLPHQPSGPHQPLMYHMPLQYHAVNQMYVPYTAYPEMMGYQAGPFMLPPSQYVPNAIPAAHMTGQNGQFPQSNVYPRSKSKRHNQKNTASHYQQSQPVSQLQSKQLDATVELTKYNSNELSCSISTKSSHETLAKTDHEPTSLSSPSANEPQLEVVVDGIQPRESPLGAFLTDEQAGAKQQNNTKPPHFPLFIDTTWRNYMAIKPKLVASRAACRSQKYKRLYKLASRSPFAICTSTFNLIDHNTHSVRASIPRPRSPQHTTISSPSSSNDSSLSSSTPSPLSQEYESPLDTEKSPETASTTSTISATAPSIRSPVAESAPNWAAILQTSKAPPKLVSRRTKLVSGDTALSPQSSTPHCSALDSHPPTPGPVKPLSDVAQPLGILVLRVMYDPAYLVLTDNLPQFNIHVRGLTNTGNICYMNAVLQILLFCAPFNRLLLLIKTRAVGVLGKTSPTPLLDASIKFFSDFCAANQTSVFSPDKFYMTLINHEKFQHIKWGQQEDAEEFLGYYLDGLNDELTSEIKSLPGSAIERLILQFQHTHTKTELVAQFTRNIEYAMLLFDRKYDREQNAATTAAAAKEDDWNEVDSSKKVNVKRTVEVEPTPISLIFGGQFRLELTVPKSVGLSSFVKSVTLDPYRHVQLNISGCETIEDAFRHMAEAETISFRGKGEDDMMVKKQTFLDSMPPVLVIHLKRFSFSQEQDHGIEKLVHHVLYTHELDVPQQVLSGQAQFQLRGYTLLGVVYHIGTKAEGGHYTSDVRATDGQWHRIDDTNITQVTPEDVLEALDPKTAYILFYVRH